MKAVYRTIFLATVILAVACHKDNVTETSITGKWKLTEVLADPGDGSGKFNPVAPKADYDYVKFELNGKLEGTVLSDYVRYSIKDSVITVFKTDNTLQNYQYKIHDGVMDMSPAGPLFCIEGCANRFVKVSN
ncbi:MAG: hypothetical protein ABIN91_01665 [Mucilaginibacter sp.]|uniref:hypothetical protein n=1 Tax=Mucilaginibacter sp. TaxID=1882438 RepID=UPI003266E578